jgi:hypothetical protein
MNPSNNFMSIPQTQLWVGQAHLLEQRVITYLQTTLCRNNGCKVCVVCKHIRARQHHAVCWVLPEKNQYSKADCEVIAQKSSFMLEADEQFFFIIPFAELLTASSANSLLKLIEEPPRGYHFIFCAERPRMLLPTIISRCVVSSQAVGSGAESEERVALVPQFLQLFKQPEQNKLATFAKTYDAAAITEQMTSLLLDELLVHWREVYRNAYESDSVSGTTNAQAMIEQLTQAYHQLPMPGSAKLFWRNLFIQLLSV